MTDKPAELPSNKYILLGTDRLEITEPLPVVPVHVDIFTECRVFAGTVHVSLAATVVEGGEAHAEARVVSRFRMSLESAVNLRDALSRSIDYTQTTKEAAD